MSRSNRPAPWLAIAIGCGLATLVSARADGPFPLDNSLAAGCTAEGTRLRFHLDTAADASRLEFPRLDNEVVQAYWEPAAPDPVAPAVPQPPNIVPADRLLDFSQSPDTWTIALRDTIRYPARIVLELTAPPLHAPDGHVCRAAADGAIVLPARHAVVTGEKLQFEPRLAKNTVGYWVNEQDRVHWLLATAAAGRWDVHVLQGCGAGQGGSRVRFACGDATAEFTVVETGHFQNFRWHAVGTLEIPAGSRHALEVACVAKRQAAVMDIRQIRLVPHAADRPSGPAALADTPPDVIPPPVTAGPPAAGRKTFLQLPDRTATTVAHTLALPTDWTPTGRYPVLVEWAGNGPYSGPFGETNSGRCEDACLAVGLAGTDGCIILGLPFLDAAGTAAVTTWWGSPPRFDAAASIAYAEEAIADTCRRFGGDPTRVVLVGFSRGSIACNALGLADDRIAGLWRAAVCFSHYDGLREWPFPGSDAASATARLGRLRGRPQLIVAESAPSPAGGQPALDAIGRHLERAGADGRFTFLETGFREHDDDWALRPSPARRAARRWLADVLELAPRDESL